MSSEDPVADRIKKALLDRDIIVDDIQAGELIDDLSKSLGCDFRKVVNDHCTSTARIKKKAKKKMPNAHGAYIPMSHHNWNK